MILSKDVMELANNLDWKQIPQMSMAVFQMWEWGTRIFNNDKDSWENTRGTWGGVGNGGVWNIPQLRLGRINPWHQGQKGLGRHGRGQVFPCWQVQLDTAQFYCRCLNMHSWSSSKKSGLDLRAELVVREMALTKGRQGRKGEGPRTELSRNSVFAGHAGNHRFIQI